ncbi:tetratricopeptide repeat protein 41 isoform X2 [Scyliorhinus canicula]|uniref:tetratricopeptide repeat protein 41 isoform X2 n=1 Tax=Scyliorhinus canicula TaxID=7830 RepID=UPI0018F41D8E|nr:tetratricopeptide repeat protein 41 isoform X2 [Scyliorhinus canicula]
MNEYIKKQRNSETEESDCLTCHPGFTYRPPIQVFLCSTSEDFQEERNYLENDIFPLLSEFCNTRRSCLKVLDVHWASQEGRHHQSTDSHQLKVSLDIITKRLPFFICMLGQKYGDYCSPDAKCFTADGTDMEALSKVEKNIHIAARNGYSWILHEDYKDCSLLELEITEAALLNDSGFSFFYFRDSQYIDNFLLHVPQNEREMIASKYKSRDHYEEQRVGELKEKIVNKGLPVEIFRTIEEFGEAVLINCRHVIDQLYPMDLVPLQTDHESYLELCYHEAFSQRYCQVFVRTTETQKVFEILDTFAVASHRDIQIEANNGLPDLKRASVLYTMMPRLKGGTSVLLLCGEKGCGKSAVICNWLKHFTQKNPNTLMITHFVGSSCASHDIMSFMRHCILKLRHEYFGAQHHPDAFSANPTDIWMFQMIREAFIAAIGLKPCVLVLDGADQLTGTHGMSASQVKEFSWLPWPLPAHCKLIVTSASSNLAYKSLSQHEEVNVVQLSNRTEDKFRIHIFKNHLAMPHKEINEHQIQNIMNRKLSTLPLALVILANELRVCGAFRNETDCLEEYLHCHSVQELWAAVFRRWIEDYSWVTEERTGSREKYIPHSSCPHSSISGMKGWIVDILCLLSISRCGLNEKDIHQLLKYLGYEGTNEVSNFDWAVFRTASMEWIQERPDGLLNFTHQTIRDAVEFLLLGVITPVNESTFKSFQSHFNCKKTHIHQLLAEYFSQQNYTLKLYQEVPWHLTMSGNLSGLCTFVSDPLIMDLIYQNSKHSYHSKLDLFHYWDLLLDSGFDPAVAYHDMVNELLVTPKVSENDDSEMLSYDSYSQATLIWFTAEFLKELDKTTAAGELLLIAQALLPESCPLSLKDTEMYFKVQYSIGKQCVSVGNLQDAEKHFRKALHSIDYAPKGIRKHLDIIKSTAQLLFKLANLIMRGGSTEIGDILHKARRATKKICDPCAEANLKILEGFRKIHVSKLFEAEQYFQQALDIRQKWYGKLHPIVAEVLEPLADLLCYPEYARSLDWSQAEEFYRQVAKIQEDSMKRARSSQIRDQINLSRALTIYKLGRLLQDNRNFQARKEANDSLRLSFGLLTELLGPKHDLTMEVQRLLKHSEIQIYKDQILLKRLAADSSGKPFSPLTKNFSQAKPSFHSAHERSKNHIHSKTLVSSQADNRQVTDSFKSVKTTHPDDCSIEKTQADDGSNVSSDAPVVLEQGKPEDNAVLEEECFGNLESGSKLYISKHALLPRPTLLTDHQESRSPVTNRNLSTPIKNRSLSGSVCRPLTICKPSTFGPCINTSVPPLRTKVGSERLRNIYQSAWHHPPGQQPKRHLIRKDTGIAQNLGYDTALLNNAI